jgi:hypothetical protein
MRLCSEPGCRRDADHEGLHCNGTPERGFFEWATGKHPRKTERPLPRMSVFAVLDGQAFEGGELVEWARWVKPADCFRTTRRT